MVKRIMRATLAYSSLLILNVFARPALAQDYLQKLGDGLTPLLSSNQIFQSRAPEKFLTHGRTPIGERVSVQDGKSVNFFVKFPKSLLFFGKNNELVAEKRIFQEKDGGFFFVSTDASYILSGNLQGESLKMSDSEGRVLWERDDLELFTSRISGPGNLHMVTPRGQFIIPLGKCYPCGICANPGNMKECRSRGITIYGQSGQKTEWDVLKNGDYGSGASTISLDGNYFAINYQYSQKEGDSDWRKSLLEGRAGSLVALYDLRKMNPLWVHRFKVPYAYIKNIYITPTGEYTVCISGTNEGYDGGDLSAYQEKAALYIFTSDGNIVHQRRIKDTVPWMKLKCLSPEGDYVVAEGRNSENEFDRIFLIGVPSGTIEWVYPCPSTELRQAIISLSRNAERMAVLLRPLGKASGLNSTVLILNKLGDILYEKNFEDRLNYIRISEDGNYLWLADEQSSMTYLKVNF